MNANESVDRYSEYFADANAMLEALEGQQAALTGTEAIRAWWASVEVCEDRFSRLKSYVFRRRMPAGYREALRELEQRRVRLPWIPRIELVAWMQNLREFPNLVVLEVDCYHRARDGSVEITRILVMDGAGDVLLDQRLRPAQADTNQASCYGGLAADGLVNALTAPQIWPALLAALAGKYVVAADVESCQIQLMLTAKRHRLAVPALVGQSILPLCRAYFPAGRCDERDSRQGDSSQDLAALCARIGFPLPAHPIQTALDRASGLLLLMQAMSEGFPYHAPPVNSPEGLKSDSD